MTSSQTRPPAYPPPATIRRPGNDHGARTLDVYSALDAARAQLAALGLTVAGLGARPHVPGRRWRDLDSGDLVAVPPCVEIDMTHDPAAWWTLAEHLGVGAALVARQVAGWRVDFRVIRGGLAWAVHTVLPGTVGGLHAGEDGDVLIGVDVATVPRIELRRSFGDTRPRPL